MPRPIALAALLTTSLRDAAAHRLQEALPARSALFERLIIGRGANANDLAQRIRLVPIPSVGTQHTDPSVRRILIEVPPNCPVRVDDLKWAFSGIKSNDLQTGEAFPGRLVSTEDSGMANRFARMARVFRSITPVALTLAPRSRMGDAGKKAAEERNREERQAVGAVVQALRHAGLRARPTSIRVQREPFRSKGVRAESFAEGSRFSKHALWHVELRFRESMSKMLVIGDGRYCGLGLMEPIEEFADVFAFNLGADRGVVVESRRALILCLRRALMSLASR